MNEKRKNGHVEKNIKSILVAVAAVFALVCAVLLSVVARGGYLSQVKDYANQQAVIKSRLVEHEISMAEAKIKLLSFEAGRILGQTTDPESHLKISSLMFDKVFDRVDIIRADGVLHDTLIDVDCSEEPFFIEGMKNHSGMQIAYHSKISQQMMVSFYTPIMIDDTVAGVVLGAMGGRTRWRNFLDSSFSGRAVVERILDSKFNIVVSTDDDADFGLPLKAKLNPATAEKDLELFHKIALSDTSVTTIEDESGISVVSIKPVGKSGLFVLVKIPSRDLTRVLNFLSVVPFVCSFLFFLIHCLVVFVMSRTSKRVRSESEDHYQNVLSALTNSFGSVVEVNLDNGDGNVIRIEPIIEKRSGGMLSRDVNYNQIMAIYIHRMVYDEDVGLFDSVKSIEDVRRAFAANSQFDFIFRTSERFGDGIHYIQALFVKPSMDRPEFVMGFKNVDKTMENELLKRKKLSEQSEALKAALERVRSADKAKSRFLFNMSHDIRTPMNAVLGYDILAMKYVWELGLPPEQTEKLSKVLENIQLSGKQLLGLINSVLNVASIENGGVSLDEAATPVSDLTGEVAVVFGETAREKNVMLLVSRKISHKFIMCDKVKMQQIILNVVSNAIKFTKSTGVVRVNFKEEPHEKDGWCNIVTTVEDNGCGISQEFLPHIFEAFEREKTATVSGVVGSGLGLSIVKKFVDLMDGQIDVKSEEGVGTTVIVKTPHRIAKVEEVEAKPPVVQDKDRLVGKRILLVEDNKMNREIAMEMLTDFGVSVECAVDGVECLEIMEQSPAGSFDLVLMDVQMPRMDGYEATRRIRCMKDPLKANIQIYAMTANAFEEDVRASMNAGMNGLISKPVDFTKFYNLLHKVFS